MVKRAHKRSTAKGRKTSKKAAKKASKKPSKKTAKKPKKRKARRRTIDSRVSGAYRAVVDTVRGTDQLRNKLEPPGTSETA